MRWCRDCGGYIEFRDVNGQARDLPECCCMGEPTPGLTTDKVRAGFCQLTSCTVCGAPVFFIRHTEGRTWFDDLAYPWPPHKCFNSPVHAVLQQLEVGDWPQLGIVLSMDEADKFQVRLQDGREVAYLLDTEGSRAKAIGHSERRVGRPRNREAMGVGWGSTEVEESPRSENRKTAAVLTHHSKLPRTLLVVDGENLSIIYPPELAHSSRYHAEPGDNKIIRYARHPLPGAVQTNRRGVPLITCEFCEETFATETEKGIHLKTHPDWPCPYCSYTTLLSEELESHIKTRHPARG